MKMYHSHLKQIISTYFDPRKENRFNWNQYARQKGTVVDLKRQARIFRWIQETGISTLEDFNAALDAQRPLFDKIKANKKRIRQLETGIGYIDTCVRLKSVADKSKRGFQFAREKYAEAHKSELLIAELLLKYDEPPEGGFYGRGLRLPQGKAKSRAVYL